MNNITIIAGQMQMLVMDGVITPDSIIDTYQGWQRRGYQVKKGEKHITEFAIWFPKNKKGKTPPEAGEGEEITPDNKGRFFLKTCYWFSDKQVQRKS